MTEDTNFQDPAPQFDPRFPNSPQSLPKLGDENALSRSVEWPMIRPPDQVHTGAGNDSFRPQQHDAFDEVVLKANIAQDGGLEFAEQTGWIYWRRLDGSVPESSSSSSSSSSSGSGGPAEPPEPPSDSESTGSKSNCIVSVPQWFSPTGFVALHCVEAPEVLFLDYWTVPITGRITKTTVDPKFNYVSEAGTLKVSSVQGDKPGSIGAKIEGDVLTLDAGFTWRLKSKVVILSLVSVRKGYAQNNTTDPFFNPRFPQRTEAQKVSVEKKVNEAYEGLRGETQ